MRELMEAKVEVKSIESTAPRIEMPLLTMTTEQTIPEHPGERGTLVLAGVPDVWPAEDARWFGQPRKAPDLAGLTGAVNALRASVDAMDSTLQKMLEIASTGADPLSLPRRSDKLFLTENEAAAVACVSPKTLADRRRAGRVPRFLYKQDRPRGKIKYNAKRWREHLGLES